MTDSGRLFAAVLPAPLKHGLPKGTRLIQTGLACGSAFSLVPLVLLPVDKLPTPRKGQLAMDKTSREFARRPKAEGVRVMQRGTLELYQAAGVQLDQADEDLYLEIINLAADVIPDESGCAVVSFTEAQMLRQLARDARPAERVRLRVSLRGLMANLYYFSSARQEFFHFIDQASLPKNSEKAEPPKDTGTTKSLGSTSCVWTVKINLGVARIFAGGYTRLDLAVRNALARNHFAKWFYGVLAGWRPGYRLTVANLREMAGSGWTGREDHFVRALRTAIPRIKTATKWKALELTDDGLEISFRKGSSLAPKRGMQIPRDLREYEPVVGWMDKPIEEIVKQLNAPQRRTLAARQNELAKAASEKAVLLEAQRLLRGQMNANQQLLDAALAKAAEKKRIAQLSKD